ncbi:MAG TPA: hypothetical protein VIH93_06825 [Thermoanaerobaculia bacterium]|jgi:hypothetical protein
MSINPVILFLTLVLVAVFFYMQWRKKQQAAAPPPPKVDKDAALRAEVDRLAAGNEESPETAYMNLRAHALETSPGRFGALAADEPYGALMEMVISSSVVSLVCFADGDASIYYKTGGGMRGGLGHEAIRKVAKEFVALAKQALPKMIKSNSQPLPGDDRVRFYVLTSQGIYTTETDRETLGSAGNELSVLYYAGQEVVTQMRQVQEQRGR